MKRFATCAVASLALLMPMAAMAADARTDYYQRAADRDTAAFRVLDVNRNGALTRVEIMGDLDFGPRFDDMDINRDGIVTQDELRRYIEQHYGVAIPAGRQRHASREAAVSRSGGG